MEIYFLNDDELSNRDYYFHATVSLYLIFLHLTIYIRRLFLSWIYWKSNFVTTFFFQKKKKHCFSNYDFPSVRKYKSKSEWLCLRKSWKEKRDKYVILHFLESWFINEISNKQSTWSDCTNFDREVDKSRYVLSPSYLKIYEILTTAVWGWRDANRLIDISRA